MSFKNIGIVLFLFLFLFPINKMGAQVTNTGFVPGNIWYSQDPFEEGDNVKIYTLIFNPDGRELSGTVVFFDNNVFFGKKDFTALGKGVKDVYLDWNVTTGTHVIFGKIENAKFLISPGKYKEVYLAENETSKSSRTVDKKIVTATPTNTNTNINSILDSVGSLDQNSINSIGRTIEDNTPSFISKPVTIAANAVETFRKNTGTALTNKQAEIKKEIDVLNLNNAKTDTKKNYDSTQPGLFETPMKFTELFALALFANVFNNKFIFYTLLFLIILLLLLYMWRRVR